MQPILPNDTKSRGRLILLVSVLIFSGAVAVVLWRNRTQADQALKTASVEKLQQIVQGDPNNAQAQRLLGTKLEEKGDFVGAKTAYKKAAELDGDNEDAWLGYARTAQAEGELQEAYSVLDVFLKTHPKSINGSLALAAFYHDQDALIRALEMGQRVTQIDPKNVRGWRRISTEALGLKRYSEAETAIRRALEIVPNDWRSYYVLGQALAGQNRYAEALTNFEKAAQLAPDQANPLREIGRMRLLTAADPNTIQQAVSALQASQKINPFDAETFLLLGRARVRQGDSKAAIDSLESAVRLAPTQPDPFFELANAYRRAGDHQRAEQIQKRHDELETYHRDANNLLSMIYQEKENASQSNQTRIKLARLYAKYGDYVLAEREYKHLLARMPGDAVITNELKHVEEAIANAPPSPADMALAENELLKEGDLLREQGKFRDAERSYAKILVRNRNSAPAYLGLGLALLGENKKDDAFRAFNRALAIDRNMDMAQFAIARLYLESNFADECIRRIDALLKKDPTNPVYLNQRGLAYQQVEVYGMAEDNFAKAVTAEPKNNDYLVNLALAQAKNSKFAEAEKNYRIALEREPTNGKLLAFFGDFLVERAQSTGNKGMESEAEEILKRSLHLLPENFTASLALGNLYLNRGDAQAALPLLLSANRQRSDIRAPYYRLALAYRKIGDKEKAAFYQKESERRTDYFNRRANTEQLARERLKDPNLRLKLARIYAEGGDNTRAINQYEVYLNMRPADESVRKEMDTLIRKAH